MLLQYRISADSAFLDGLNVMDYRHVGGVLSGFMEALESRFSHPQLTGGHPQL